MGRIRGKGKKQSIVAAGDDAVTGEDEKIPIRRRGRPQKPLKDEIEEGEKSEKIEEENDEDDNNTLSSVLIKSSKNQPAKENGRKRKRPSLIKDHADSVKEENDVGTNANTTDLVKSVGFRQNGSRRKNKPRRAAEVGVECK
ncbi:uncharacterized protein LOC111403856 [Olea europaea var. sylvestris]|uniref:Uncharacterized protein n=1 Tax=Olea europaea subsp. europaea TaxID=158383 RepID=A0A8S0SPD1_OLEEU|nr:uncharacterized protein LOC111403856 [Olea europaea var. sylvestris]XP_022888256.1 uncharacterized protein LOC111403856 [Olea europaea var. sylvestris]XP_022888257.1 uncharacterized protein LOC111403856 [Olea europaea var. sylvestris]CAA2938959.1 Hypothetical predicted protein [Olea europaea subsp. europaea]CAA2993941.1 Hypothetical predicted protein [Olea europaea subsp. europaea]